MGCTVSEKGEKDKGASRASRSWWGALDQLNDATFLTPMGIVNRLYGSPVRGSVRDAIAQTLEGAIGLIDPDRGEHIADKFRTAWNRVAYHVDGVYDFRMANGWKMPEGMKYNGKLPTDPGYQGPKVGQPIESFWSLFLRDKDGRIEVIDKNDSRFAKIMGPYAATQVGIATTVGTKGLTSIRSAFSAAEGVLGKSGSVASLTLGSADAWGGAKMLVQTLNRSLILEPEAIDRFAKIFQNPEALTIDRIRADLNLVMNKFSRREGSNTAQYYIPPVTTAAETLQLLDQASKGLVRGFERKHPFADIPETAEKRDTSIRNIREVYDSPHFKRGFYQLAAKALTGKELNPAEHLALRFGLNVLYAQKDLPLSGAGVSQAQYTKEDYQKTMKFLREELSVPVFAQKVAAYLRKTEGNLSDNDLQNRLMEFEVGWRQGTKTTLIPDAELVKNLNEKVSEIDKKFAAERHGAKSPMIQSRMDNPFSFN